MEFREAKDKDKIIEVKNLGDVGWKSFRNAFWLCKKLSKFTSGNTDTSQVTNMSSMFSGALSLISLDLSAWNVGSLTSASDMFKDTYRNLGR